MTWLFRGEPIEILPEGYVGFTYLITNNINGMKYFGKKLAHRKITKKPLKGRTQKRHSIVESDWKTYWGSSDALLADIEKMGRENFTREILEFHETRGNLSYAELKLQMENDVLFRGDYYNNIIQVRIHARHLKKF